MKHIIRLTILSSFFWGQDLGYFAGWPINDSKDDIMNKVSGSLYLDFNNDDYYKHNIPNCPDLYMSEFLTN